jgi:hypothetical protein
VLFSSGSALQELDYVLTSYASVLFSFEEIIYTSQNCTTHNIGQIGDYIS